MELFTENLMLRPVDITDIDEVARVKKNEKGGTISLEEAREAIEEMQNNHTKNKPGYIYNLCFAVFEKGKNKIIGWCGFDGRLYNRFDIFYSIDPMYRNRGYATQCAKKLLSYAFDEVRLPYVHGGCDKNNTAAFKIMSKIGMVQNAFVPETGDPLFFIDEAMYRALVI